MLDEYFRLIDAFVCKFKDVPVAENLDKLVNKNDHSALRLIEIQKELMVEKDIKGTTGYLEIGYFNTLSAHDRIAAFLSCFEIENRKLCQNLKNRYNKYSQNQNLFLNNKLFNPIRKRENGNPDYELIELEAVSSIDDSEVVKIDNGYAKIDSFLNPNIVWWSKTTFPESPIFLRLNPEFQSREEPLRMLNEEILMPADPSWWKKLKIHKNNTSGSSYVIQDPVTPVGNLQKHWDYHVNGIRNLQVFCKRNNSGNLSIMFEELSVKYINSGVLLGRCIHFDSNAPFGTDISNAELNHLDLALNFYEGDSINSRQSQDLALGKVENANFRSHLFRIERIPFESIIAYVMMFLKSDYLKVEWLNDQIIRQKQ